MENWDGKSHHLRGTDGPLSVHSTKGQTHPLCDHFLSAAEQLQIPVNDDYNADSMEGASLYQITTDNGWRGSTARCYLRPASNRKNLTIRINAQVTQLVFKNNRCEQVRYKHRGKIKTVKANKEVVLCCLLYTSPSPRDGLLSRMPSSA